MEKILTTTEKYILYIVLGLFPIFVLSSFPSPYVVPKELLLIGGVCLILLIWVAKMILKGSLTFYVGKFDLPVLAITLAYILSTTLATPNKMEAYLFPGSTTFVIGGALLYFLINQFDHKVKNSGIISLFISSLLLALTILLSSLNIFSKIPQLPDFMKDASYNPMGGAIPTIILLVVTLIFSISIILREREMVKKVFFGASLAVIVFALVVLIYSSLPGHAGSPKFVSTRDSWEVMIDTLKKSPLLGAGPSNYLTAFNLYRPINFNHTDLWQVRFTTASNFYFTLITETGLLGLFAVFMLLLSVSKYLKSEFKNLGDTTNISEKLALVAMLVLFAFLPISPVLIVLLFAVLALFTKAEHKTLHLNVATSETDSSKVMSRIPAIILGLPFIAGVIIVLFYGTKILAAEATFKKSLDALTANDAKKTYDLMNSAINQNPRVDRYHANFAQVNMALASSLAQKKNINESERSTITQLVQQAISEGKATVTLNPSRSANWEILSQIYRSVMPFAQGAGQFTIQTYSQAVALDPINPNLRIALGGVYYSLGDFDNAIDAFRNAVYAKPDLANAHYNLAIAYREKKNYDNAITEMKSVINLVNKNSEDFKVAQQALTDLEAKKTAAKAPAQSSDNLTPPKPAEGNIINPPLELPKEATPPASQ